MKKSLCFIILTMFFIPFLSTPKSYAKTSNDEMCLNPLENNTSYKMDTSHWKTVPFGRYLIKLPPKAYITSESLSFNDGSSLRKIKDLEAINAHIKASMKTMQKATSDKIEYIENFGVNECGVFFSHYFNKEDGMYPSGVGYHFTFMNKIRNSSTTSSQRTQNAYTFKHYIYGVNQTILDNDELRKYQRKQEKFISYLPNHLYSVDKNAPLEIKKGIYSQNAFLELGDINEFSLSNERTHICVNFPEYPDWILIIDFRHTNPYFNMKDVLQPEPPESEYCCCGEPLDESECEEGIKQAPYNKYIAERLELAGVYMEIKPNTMIAGRKAEEILTWYTKNGVKQYYFVLYANENETKSFDKPFIEISLEQDVLLDSEDYSKVSSAPDLKKNSFPSDEEALAFWNAIKENIRWRPDCWIVPLLKEAQGKPYFIVNDKIVPVE